MEKDFIELSKNAFKRISAASSLPLSLCFLECEFDGFYDACNK